MDTCVECCIRGEQKAGTLEIMCSIKSYLDLVALQLNVQILIVLMELLHLLQKRITCFYKLKSFKSDAHTNGSSCCRHTWAKETITALSYSSVLLEFSSMPLTGSRWGSTATLPSKSSAALSCSGSPRWQGQYTNLMEQLSRQQATVLPEVHYTPHSAG